MTTSRTVVSARISHVYVRDITGPRRVIRTLVDHPDLPAKTRLLPLQSDDLRLTGIVLNDSEVGPEWSALKTAVRWESGRVPVGMTQDGTLLFWTRQQLHTDRLTTLATTVSAAMQADDEPLLQRVASIEHADGLAAGHPIQRRGGVRKRVCCLLGSA